MLIYEYINKYFACLYIKTETSQPYLSHAC